MNLNYMSKTISTASMILYFCTQSVGISAKEEGESWLNSTVSTVISLKKRLNLGCLFVVHCATSDSVYDTEKQFQLGKGLTLQYQPIGIPDLDRMRNKIKCLKNRPLYIMLLINNTARECVQKVSKKPQFSDGLWLIFLSSPTQEVFQSLPVPFNSFVVVAHYQRDSVLLEEVYRIAPHLPLIIRRVGTWSKTTGGLSWTQQNVHSRRNSLRGMTLKAISDHGEHLEWDTYTKPFNLELWISVFGTVIVLTILLSLIHQFGRENGNAEKMFPRLHYSLYEAFFYVLGAFSMQGGDVTPKASSCRVVYFLSFIIAVVLLAAYGGILISFIAIKHEELPFTNLEGILKFKKFQFGVIQNSTEFSFFKDADKNSVQGRIFSTLIMKDPKNCPETDQEALERICSTKYAYMAPTEYVHHLMGSAKCEIQHYQEKYMSASLGIALTNNCEYKKLFNRNLQAMIDGGVLQKMWMDTWAAKPSPVEANWEGVVVNHVTPLLAFFGISILLSLLFLLCERKLLLHRNTLPFSSEQTKQPIKKEWKPTPWMA
ncbi:hypothetical protein C0J52_14395 [Blattella germanica]|nr:hypothetical protein C0J52_14395 [Blattella germanica]